MNKKFYWSKYDHLDMQMSTQINQMDIKLRKIMSENNNYTDPDGQCMDDMNELRAKHEYEAELIRQCYKIVDDGDDFRPIATRAHIQLLLSRISSLEQSLLSQKPYEP